MRTNWKNYMWISATNNLGMKNRFCSLGLNWFDYEHLRNIQLPHVTVIYSVNVEFDIDDRNLWWLSISQCLTAPVTKSRMNNDGRGQTSLAEYIFCLGLRSFWSSTQIKQKGSETVNFLWLHAWWSICIL